MKRMIMERLNCNEATAARLEEKLTGIADELKPILNAWLEEGTEDSDIDFHGYSVNSLMRNHGVRFTGALLTLDWLIREPEKAAEALRKGIM